MSTATEVTFHPINDQVLIKMDVKRKSVLELGVNDRPEVLPSGIVIAVGRGVFAPGVGWIEPQVKAGDHVAVSMDGPWVNLPLTDRKDGDVHIAVSESLILGKLEGADIGSAWFAASDEAPTTASRVIR